MSQTLESILEHLRSGKFVIVTDDASRENEGDLIALGVGATEENLAFMIRYSSGVICAAITSESARRLNLPPMTRINQDSKGTAFTVSIDVKDGLTTGISAKERANTLRHLADPKAKAQDFVRPGHIFPLTVRPGGLRERRGHTEAAVELAVLAGHPPMAFIAELVNDDGTMMRDQSLRDFAAHHHIPIVTIEEIAKASIFNERITFPDLTWAKLPTHYGNWQIASFPGYDGTDHLILKYGEPGHFATVRIHSECATGDALGSLRCDCGPQLAYAMERISELGSGYIVYLRGHEGRGIGIAEKIKAYALQDAGMDTVDANLALGHPADLRDFKDAGAILTHLQVNQVRLLTNNPRKADALDLAGIRVEIETTDVGSNPFNESYIATKREKFDHLAPSRDADKN
ncbi:MAG: 3,4-dihydroxy-2-butanone-4-phosphate synthase [Candidatus Nanopelagicaceae bacterium]